MDCLMRPYTKIQILAILSALLAFQSGVSHVFALESESFQLVDEDIESANLASSNFQFVTGAAQTIGTQAADNGSSDDTSPSPSASPSAPSGGHRGAMTIAEQKAEVKV